MTVKERILAIRLIEAATKDPIYARGIGLSAELEKAAILEKEKQHPVFTSIHNF